MTTADKSKSSLSRFTPAFISRQSTAPVSSNAGSASAAAAAAAAGNTYGHTAAASIANFLPGRRAATVASNDRPSAASSPRSGVGGGFTPNDATSETSEPKEASLLSRGFKLNGPIAAFAANPSRTQVVLTGREQLCVINVDSHESTEVCNLRQTGRLNPNYNSNDVKWGNGATKSMVATASTNGVLVLWDLEKEAPVQVDRIISEHRRAINRIDFNPVVGHWILSGSQDGTMRIWDLRAKSSQAGLVLYGKSESVRDVQFSKTNSLDFAAAFENGSIQKWDIRKPAMYERRINAHNGLALSIDWHPDGKRLASAGRDKVIKIWDLTSEVRRPTSYIATADPVFRIAWRPTGRHNPQTSQIASCSLMLDNRIQVWDLNRPFVASRVIEFHDNGVTGLMWVNENSLWSCSKDKWFMRHDVNVAPQPVDRLSHQALDWSSRMDLTFISHNKFRKTRAHSRRSTGLYDTTKRSRDSSVSSLVKAADLHQHFGTLVLPAFDYEGFFYLAKNYHFLPSREMSLDATLEYNAKMAFQANRHQAAQTWQLLRMCLDWQLPKATPIKHQHQSPYLKPFTPSLQGTPKAGPQKVATKAQTLVSSPLVEPQRHSNLTASLRLAAAGASPQTTIDTSPQPLSEAVPLLPPSIDPSLQHDFSTSDSSHFSKSFESITNSSGSDNLIKETVQNPLSASANDDANAFYPPLQHSSSPWNMSKTVEATTQFYAEQGDVQMSACLLILMGRYTDLVQSDIAKDTIWSYVDLLRRLDLADVAASLVKVASESAIRELGQSDTTVLLTCHRCFKPLLNSKSKQGFWYCERCWHMLDGCIVCRLPVKSLYVWCQDCSHGGHSTCVTEWFNHHSECPSGCGHKCL